MVPVRVTRPARSRLSDVYLRKPFNRSRFYAFLSNGSESGNFQTKAIVRPSSHSECSESLVFAFINTQRESFKASWPVVKGSLTETEGCSFSWFCRSVLVESCSVWTMKREELREVKGRHRWLTLLLTCWFLTHLPSRFTHPCLSLAPDFVSIMIVALKGNFPSEIFRYFLLCFGRILTLCFFSCPCCVMMWCRTCSRKLSQCCC